MEERKNSLFENETFDELFDGKEKMFNELDDPEDGFVEDNEMNMDHDDKYFENMIDDEVVQEIEREKKAFEDEKNSMEVNAQLDAKTVEDIVDKKESTEKVKHRVKRKENIVFKESTKKETDGELRGKEWWETAKVVRPSTVQEKYGRLDEDKYTNTFIGDYDAGELPQVNRRENPYYRLASAKIYEDVLKGTVRSVIPASKGYDFKNKCKSPCVTVQFLTKNVIIPARDFLNDTYNKEPIEEELSDRELEHYLFRYINAKVRFKVDQIYSVKLEDGTEAYMFYGNRKDVVEQQIKGSLLKNIKNGKIAVGKTIPVQIISNFRHFIILDCFGLEVRMSVSEYSHLYVYDMREIPEIENGRMLWVKVKELNYTEDSTKSIRENIHIVLSRKDLMENPIPGLFDTIQEGERLTGRVVYKAEDYLVVQLRDSLLTCFCFYGSDMLRPFNGSTVFLKILKKNKEKQRITGRILRVSVDDDTSLY